MFFQLQEIVKIDLYMHDFLNNYLSLVFVQGVHEKRYRKFQPVSWIPITAKI